MSGPASGAADGPAQPPAAAAGPAGRPLRGYLHYLVAAALFAFNGTVAKTILLGGMDPVSLTQLRVTGAFAILLAVVALRRPAALRLRRSELPLLLLYGAVGITGTQFLYFVAIGRIPIGLALLVEFTSPLLIALWFRIVLGHRAPPVVWIALVTSLAGLAVVARLWEGFTFDALGVAAAAGASVSIAIYYLSADVQLRRPRPRDPVSLTMWGMGASALVWVIASPWWSFPFATLAGTTPLVGSGTELPTLALAAWMVVMGTVVPFSLVVRSLADLRASQAATVGMTEPVLAIAIAWLLLGEALAPVQVLGAAVVIGSILVVERNR